MADYDVIIIGSGADGLAAALEIARADHSLLMLEAAPTFGGCLKPMEKAGYRCAGEADLKLFGGEHQL